MSQESTGSETRFALMIQEEKSYLSPWQGFAHCVHEPKLVISHDSQGADTRLERIILHQY